MPLDIAAAYRAHALECRQRGADTEMAADRAGWLRMADDWQSLAEQAETTGLAMAALIARHGAA